MADSASSLDSSDESTIITAATVVPTMESSSTIAAPPIIHDKQPEISTERIAPIATAKRSSNANDNSVTDDNGFTYFKCPYCGLTFNYISTLKAHERVHDVMQPYVCPKCDNAFHYMCELEYHMKEHTDQKGWKCQCGRTFYQYTDLLYHKHPDEIAAEAAAAEPQLIIKSASSIRADPSDFPTPSYAQDGFEPKHPLKIYSDVRLKPYICQYCSKSYADSRSLAYHMYGHRGERTFNPRASRYLMARNDNSYISPGI